jgi:TolA-binding protein
MLEESSVEEDEGYYRFRYIIQGTDSEAEVRIDGSSGEIFRREEELEPENQQIEQVETAQVTSLQEARDRIRDLRETVTELRRENARLRSAGPRGPAESAEDGGREREVEVRRGPNETEVEAEAEVNGSEVGVEAERTEDGAEAEVEVEVRRGPNETEVEAEAEVNGSEVGVEAERTEDGAEAEVEVEGRQGPPEREQTPGSDTARQNRPGFVNRVLSGIFG